MEYIQVDQNTMLPDISGFSPFKAVIAIEDQISQHRREIISNWLIQMGGLYVMICGDEIALWSASIRKANMDQNDINTMTPDQFVMITEHENERLRNVFWHAKKYAKHTHANLQTLVVIHVSNHNRAVDYMSIFNKA
jgi:hypothetical protein